MTVVYPGSFDPVTNGHLDIIRRAAALSGMLIIGLLVNHLKKSMFTVEERLGHLTLITKEMGNVKVEASPGLLMDFARDNGASAIIRGMRGNTIPEYEFQTALGIREESGIETLFMFSRPEYIYMSSTMVKEIFFRGGSIENMVPSVILSDIFRKMKAD